MLTNGFKISDTTKKTFSEWNFSRMINKADKTTSAQITAVFGTL